MKNTPTPPGYQQKIANIISRHIRRVQKIAVEENRNILHKRLESLRRKNHSLVSKIDRKVALIILATLYWCEGGKYPSRNGIQFGNTDPKMIALFLQLLRTCFKLEELKFRLTLQCRADQNIIKLSNYWMKLTKIPRSQHYNPVIDSRSIGKTTQKKKYRGVCVIYYFDTDIQCELQFLGEYLGSDSALEKMKNTIK